MPGCTIQSEGSLCRDSQPLHTHTPYKSPGVDLAGGGVVGFEQTLLLLIHLTYWSFVTPSSVSVDLLCAIQFNVYMQ